MINPSRIFAYGLFLMVLLCPFYAQAQDIFVKPNNSAAHPADLGLAAKPSAQPPAPPVEHPTQPPAPVQNVPSPPPVIEQPIQVVKPAPVEVPTVLPAARGDLQIIPVPEEAPSLPPGSGANVLSVSLSPGILSTQDKNEIYTTLGLSEKEINANCIFEHMVVIGIGDGGESLSLGQLKSAQYRFNGAIASLDIFPNIACRKIRTPINGIVIDQGGFYKLGLQNISCPVPRSGSANLAFRYNGATHGDCAYR